MIKSEISKRAFFISLNNKSGENRLNISTLNQIYSALEKGETDKNVDVIVIKSELEYFSKGAPIDELVKFNEAESKIYAKLGQNIIKKIREIKKPVIACVSGDTLGGSFEIVLACDLILSTNDARFGFDEVNLGFIPGFGGSQIIAKKSHETLAKYLIFTGEKVDAEFLKRYGIFLSTYKDKNELELNLNLLLEKFESKSLFAIGLAKETINSGLEIDFNQALLIEQNAFTVAFASNDKVEGMSAFLEKRSPEFKDRWEDFEEIK
jgi:enoyl-CoA hydratase